MQLPLVPTPWPFRAASSSGAVCFSRSYPRLLPPLLMLLAVWALVRVPIPTTQVVERKWGFPPSRSASTDSVEWVCAPLSYSMSNLSYFVAL